MIKAVVFDIDGVITDGKILVNSKGEECKTINLKDIDAINQIKNSGYIIGAITGEDTEITNYFQNRLPWDFFIKGEKDKLGKIKELEEKLNLTSNEICYIGDGKYDIPVLKHVGLSVCPQNAIYDVKEVSDIVLKSYGGEGCVWELLTILTELKEDNGFYSYFNKLVYNHSLIFKSLLNDTKMINDIYNISEKIVNAFQNGNKLLLCGNGGSAADAQHIATEFVSRFYLERKGYDAEALSVNTSSITAIANDYNYDRVFARQVEAKGIKGDVLIGFSTSGKSKNVLEAFKVAKEKGMSTIMLTGLNAPDYDFVDFNLKIDSIDTPRIQEAHIFVGHIIAEYVEKKLFTGE